MGSSQCAASESALATNRDGGGSPLIDQSQWPQHWPELGLLGWQAAQAQACRFWINSTE